MISSNSCFAASSRLFISNNVRDYSSLLYQADGPITALRLSSADETENSRNLLLSIGDEIDFHADDRLESIRVRVKTRIAGLLKIADEDSYIKRDAGESMVLTSEKSEMGHVVISIPASVRGFVNKGE